MKTANLPTEKLSQERVHPIGMATAMSSFESCRKAWVPLVRLGSKGFTGLSSIHWIPGQVRLLI